MKLADAKLLNVGDRVLARFAGKTREGWITHIEWTPTIIYRYTVFSIAVLGERDTWAVYPRAIVAKVEGAAGRAYENLRGVKK